jgi:hypothetical protein
MMVADTPRMILTDNMMNQMNHLTHPLEIRSSVIPNDVLLHAAARIVANPAEYEMSETMGILV